MISFICSRCHAVSEADADMLDSGAVLRCSKCNTETIVLLLKESEYLRFVGGCYLKSKFKQCCCNCKYWFPLHYQCSSREGKSLRRQLKKDQCVCSIQKGWVCVHPEMGVAYSYEEKHSVGCELYEPKG